VRKSRLVRQAVVLSEKEFCVILDADGKRQIKRGPARVFPGPYDSFMTKGSRDRIYDAYELLPQRALWLRFIAPIARDKLANLLPRGVDLDQDVYHPGDELILTGVNSFFFPFNEVEILHPLTGQRHVGNDHSDIFIEAIGIDQKSGIYVRDLTTGEARLVRGKQSYLVDPRKEVHITRTIPADDWNLWIAVGEPHKLTGAAVTTPWAISIVVPHNTAVLATSADGQRVIEGPCVELLEYEETLAPLNLSTGRPKSDERTVRTCFLRTVGNRVSDVISLETADFVTVDVEVSYQVNFDPQYRDSWFNHENYVGVMCDHLRSLVRGRARQMALTELWPNIPVVIRDVILGERTAEGRQGRLFEDNGMRVHEVEVLSSTILDREIAHLLESVQRESVALVIGDRQSSEKLRSEKLRHEIERQRLDMQREATERKATLSALVRKLEQEARLADIRGNENAELEAAQLGANRHKLVLVANLERESLQSDSQIARQRDAAAAQVEVNRLLHDEEQVYRQALTNLEIQTIEARSKATVAERQAIQPSLVEALTALGDKIMLGEVAHNMNLVSLFKGKDVATIFAEMLGGTKLGRTIASQLPAGAGDASKSES
jgi:major vault protein